MSVAELSDPEDPDVLPGNLALIREQWERERAAFEALDDVAVLGLERHRQAPPEVVELSVLTDDAGSRMGFLLELPEPLDFGRISQIAALRGADQGLQVVKSAAGTRLYLLDLDGDAIQTLAGGQWSLEMSFQGIIEGWLAPPLTRSDGFEQEGAGLCFELGADLFR